MIRDDATERQVRAADPANSTWLSANAGSGKTRVLTDRVARLLLDGTDPQNILCLTYTKAAASEMQNRLFRRLGEWAMMEDTALREALDTDVAAVITEPVQGIAGIVEPPEGWLSAVAEAVHEVGALLIADEIQSGMGRMGVPLASLVAGNGLTLLPAGSDGEPGDIIDALWLR